MPSPQAEPESTASRGESPSWITAQRRSAAFEGVHPAGAPPIDPGPRPQQGFIHDLRGIQAEQFTTGLVLGAGGSRRLGQPKQLLPYGDRTLLDHTVQTARECGFHQLVVPVGGASDEVRERVDLTGADVVVNYDYGEGCSSSIAAALATVDPRCEVLVLLLGDQPGVTPEIVRSLLDGRGDAPAAVCRYDDERGHPFAFARRIFPQLADLHGDKGVWRLLDERADEVVEVRIAGNVPLDVDTPEDYQAVLAEAGFTEVTA